MAGTGESYYQSQHMLRRLKKNLELFFTFFCIFEVFHNKLLGSREENICSQRVFK